MSERFDRIRPRQGHQSLGQDGRAAPSEGSADGRRSLFSVGGEAMPGGRTGLALHCSRCRASSALDAGVAVRAAIPLFLVLPWREHPIFALCPACDRRSWLRLGAARER